jgi:6-phosphogluconate dehydrogenase
VATRQRDPVVIAGPDGGRLGERPALAQFTGRITDSGEGRWMIKAAIHQAVTSRGGADYQDKLLSAMRYRFGGHLD